MCRFLEFGVYRGWEFRGVCWVVWLVALFFSGVGGGWVVWVLVVLRCICAVDILFFVSCLLRFGGGGGGLGGLGWGGVGRGGVGGSVEAGGGGASDPSGVPHLFQTARLRRSTARQCCNKNSEIFSAKP